MTIHGSLLKCETRLFSEEFNANFSYGMCQSHFQLVLISPFWHLLCARLCALWGRGGDRIVKTVPDFKELLADGVTELKGNYPGLKPSKGLTPPTASCRVLLLNSLFSLSCSSLGPSHNPHHVCDTSRAPNPSIRGNSFPTCFL